MTPELSFVGVFCEDIREEVGGQTSIIGIYPDNIQVPSFPGQMAKLSFYVRVHVQRDYDPGELKLFMRGEGFPLFEIGRIDQSLIDQGKAESEGLAIYGLITHGSIAPFPVPNAGVVQLVVQMGDSEFVAGRVKFAQTPS